MILLPPPSPTKKPIAFFDTECYRNFWLLKFGVQNGAIFTFVGPLSYVDRERIKVLFDLFTVVSFNGIYYDVPMIQAALAGFGLEELHSLSTSIIREQVKPWELNLPPWKPSDHIDIMEVLPGAGSQKQYAGRIHYKTMRDLPYDPEAILTPEQIIETSVYCENDLGQLQALFEACGPMIETRENMTARYGVDLRSKSDAQVAETVLKHRCEQALGRRIYKSEIDWNLAFRYEPPAFLSFITPQLQNAFQIVCNSVFRLGASGAVEMPPTLAGLDISIGLSVYRMGIGGLHSQEKCRVLRSDDEHILTDADVRGYYPRLILNSGRYPLALGPQFLTEFGGIVDERDVAKALEQELSKLGNVKDPAFVEGYRAYSENAGGKVASVGTFGKTGSPYSILFAPQMLIQTTLTGQLSLLMLIEQLEYYGISVVSANTDGIVIKIPRVRYAEVNWIIKEWEKRTGLEMEFGEYSAIYSRDINSYFAITIDGKVKRKGAYGPSGLIAKVNPDSDICAEAVADYLSKRTELLYTIATCADIRKFVSVRKVTGGAVKMWGEGPNDDLKVKDIEPILIANGWTKIGRRWYKPGMGDNTIGGGWLSRDAYEKCFAPQTPEYVGKVIRWYYSTQAPGPIVYSDSGNQVPMSYGAKPCMTLPDDFPNDIDYNWYLQTAMEILKKVGL